jgi:hypothetical protein
MISFRKMLTSHRKMVTKMYSSVDIDLASNNNL